MLTNPNHLCLIIGSEQRPRFVPTCVCEILAGQSFRHPLPKDALSMFNNIKAERSQNLFGIEKLISLANQALPLSALSIDDGVGNPLLSLSAEVIACQRMARTATQAPDAAKRFAKNKFKIAFVQIGNAPAISKTAEVFQAIFAQKLRDLNMGDLLFDCNTLTLKQSTSLESWQKGLDSLVNADTGGENTNNAPDGGTTTAGPFVLTFLEGGPKNHQNYRKIKQVCDTDLGWHNCCVNLSSLDKLHRKNTDSGIDDYASFLLRKMLIKSESNYKHSVMRLQNATLLIGAHVVEVSAGPTTNGLQISDAETSSVYCITLASKPIGSKDSYKVTTLLKKALGPVSILLV